MGLIWRVHDTVLGRDLALKVLRPELQDRPDLLQRFLEEARIAGQLQHPGIVPVHELGQLEDFPAPYFTMKLIQGKTLGEVIACRDEPGGHSRLLLIFQQVCQTLAFAHARGVIHRDLKPSNIMVGDFGEVQVMDWGVAKLLRSGTPEVGGAADTTAPLIRPDGSGDLSVVGSVVGTPGYMAPEQARGESHLLDERCDVFGLGAILCEILTGEPPYQGSDTTVIAATASGCLDQVARLLATCQAEPELIRLAQRCLAAEREARPRHAGEVAEAITRHLNSVAERLRQAELAAERDRTQRQQQRKARKLAFAFGATVLFSLVVGGGAVGYSRFAQSARQQRIRREVEYHLNESARLRDEARKQPPTEIEKWLEALAAARQARASLVSGEASPELADRVNRALTSLQAEADAARDRAEDLRRDQIMLLALQEAQARTSDVIDDKFALYQAEPVYLKAYRAYGVPVLDLPPEEAALGLRGRAIERHLAEGLYFWANCTRDRNRGAHLRAVLNHLDPDPWRASYRKASGASNGSELRRLAATADLQTQPIAILIQLSQTLAGFGWDGDIEASLGLLRRLQKHYPSDFWVNHHLAMALHNVRPRQSQEALGYFRAAAALRPHSPGLYLNMATVLSALGRDDQSREALEKAIELKPDYAMAYNSLGAYHNNRGDYQRAIVLFRKAISLRDTDPTFFEYLGNAHANLNEFDQALAAYQRAVALDPNYLRGHQQMAEILHKRGDHGGANRAVARVLRLDEHHAPAHRLKAALAARMGDRKTSYEAARRAAQLAPNDELSWRLLGWCADQLGLVGEAQDAWRRSIELAPGNADALFRLGTSLTDHGHPGQAVDFLDRAARLEPDSAESRCNLGLALYWSGQFERAVVELRQGHEQGSRKRDWSYPSAFWLKRAEFSAANHRRLTAVVTGKEVLTTRADTLHFAVMAGIRGYHAEAVRLFEVAFTEQQPASELRNLAAYSAVQAANGIGHSLKVLSPKEAKELRCKGLNWLRENLDHLTQQLTQQPAASDDVAQALAGWQHDERLGGVRGDRLQSLAEVERADWVEFWLQVRKAEAKARESAR